METTKFFLIKDGAIVHSCCKCGTKRRFRLISGTVSRIKIGTIRAAFHCGYCGEAFFWISLPLADYTRLIKDRTGPYILEEGILKPMKMMGGG
jgi:hypothetical protein